MGSRQGKKGLGSTVLEAWTDMSPLVENYKNHSEGIKWHALPPGSITALLGPVALLPTTEEGKPVRKYTAVSGP